MSGKVKPMTFHAPGWSVTEKIDGKKIEYQVWAPGAITHQGRETDKVRDFWQGAWTGRSGYTGDVRRGSSMEDALAIFPRDIAEKFRKVIKS
jgi:hypothetical protein